MGTVLTAAVSTGGASTTYRESCPSIEPLFSRTSMRACPQDNLLINSSLLALVTRTIVATTSDVDRNASFLHIPFAGHWKREGSCRVRIRSMAIGAHSARCAFPTVPGDKVLPKYVHMLRQEQDHLFLLNSSIARGLGISMVVSPQ